MLRTCQSLRLQQIIQHVKNLIAGVLVEFGDSTTRLYQDSGPKNRTGNSGRSPDQSQYSLLMTK